MPKTAAAAAAENTTRYTARFWSVVGREISRARFVSAARKRVPTSIYIYVIYIVILYNTREYLQDRCSRGGWGVPCEKGNAFIIRLKNCRPTVKTKCSRVVSCAQPAVFFFTLILIYCSNSCRRDIADSTTVEVSRAFLLPYVTVLLKVGFLRFLHICF